MHIDFPCGALTDVNGGVSTVIREFDDKVMLILFRTVEYRLPKNGVCPVTAAATSTAPAAEFQFAKLFDFIKVVFRNIPGASRLGR